MNLNQRSVVIFSSCPEFWGGSEELWSQAAEILAQNGFEIYVFKFKVDFQHPKIKRLRELGCRVTDLQCCLPSLARRVQYRLLPHSEFRTLPFYLKTFLARRLREIKPQLFIIAQGANFDGLFFVSECRLDQIPYVIIAQKATDALWADDDNRKWMKKLWANAKKCYFVSQHNLRVTQEQFGMTLENAEVVRNPFLTSTEKTLPWNFTGDKIRLACVGRLFLLEKGQDILLRLLADKKWRERDLEVSFFGKGINEQGLKELGQYLKLDNLFFKGHVSDIERIWQEHQALILPSRAEGLPLVIIEAMLCGRVPIVTDVGGNAEVISDNVTGFVARSADKAGLDDALERAWQRRAEWENIGQKAAESVRQQDFINPAQDFAAELLAVIEKENSSVKRDFR